MKKKGTGIVIVAVLVIAVLAGVHLWRARKPEVEIPYYATCLPERSFLYVGLQDLGKAREECPLFSALAEVRSLNFEEDIATLVAEGAELKEVLGVILTKGDEIGKVLDELGIIRILGEEAALAVFDHESGQSPSLVVATRIGDKVSGRLEEAINPLLEELSQGEIVTVEEWDAEGTQVKSLVSKQIKLDTGEVSPSVAFPPGHFVFTSSRVAMQEFLSALKGNVSETLSGNETFREIQGKLPGPAHVRTYTDFGRIASLLEGLASGPGRQLLEEKAKEVDPEAVLHYVNSYLSFLSHAGAMGTATVFGKDAIRKHSYLLLDEKALGEEMRELYVKEPGAIRTLAFVPSQVLAFAGARGLKPTAFYNWAEGVLATEPVYGKPLLEKWETVQNEFGFQFKEDLLSWVGEELGVISYPPTQMMMVSTPRVAYLLEVTDEEKAKTALTELTNIINENTGAAIEVGQDEYQNVTINVFTPPFPGLQPCYAIVEGFLILSLDKATLQEIIDCRRQEGETIKANRKFQQVADYVKEPANSLGFSDAGQQMESTTSTIQSMFQMQRMALTMAAGRARGAEEEEANEQGRPGKEMTEKQRQALFRLMDKTVKAMKMLHIMDAQGSSCVFDGKGYYGKQITTFREKKEEPE